MDSKWLLNYISCLAFKFLYLNSVVYVDSMSEWRRILARHDQVVVYAYYLSEEQGKEIIKSDGTITTSLNKRTVDLNKQKIQDALILSENNQTAFAMLNMYKGDLYKFSKEYELDGESGDVILCFYKNMLREVYDVSGEVDQIVIRRFVDSAFDKDIVYKRGSKRGKHKGDLCDCSSCCHRSHGSCHDNCCYSYPRFGVGFYSWPGYWYRRPWWGCGGRYGYYW